MKKPSTWLAEYQSNVHSQSGEDGIIAKILEVLPGRDKWCVEFGAWDGLYQSNTRHLIESAAYSAVLIEADRDKFLELQRNYAKFENVIPINEAVGFLPHDNLDDILSDTPIPRDFDLLSIDIDGNDYHVWKQVSAYRPKTVVVEFNPTIPTHIRFVQAADPAVNQGSSLLSFVELARDKGYELVCVLLCNAFFVRREDYAAFEIESNAPEVLRTNLDLITHLFSGYDGTIFLRGYCRLPWHGMPMKESKVQQLPGMLRRFSGNYSARDKRMLMFYVLAQHPRIAMKRLRRWLSGLITRNT